MIVLEHHQRPAETGPWPQELDAVLPPAMLGTAAAEIAAWPGYAPTRLRSLDVLAGQLGIAQLLYKDESGRLGLGSFKALGGAYAVLCLAAERVAAATGQQPPLAEIRAGDHAALLAGLTVATATDGNHGRSVAWGARLAGCRCRVYIHAGVSAGRQAALEALGAEVRRIDGDYDASVRLCAAEAAAEGLFVVSDTSYDGYGDLPRQVMAGYSVMAAEVLDQVGGHGAAGSAALPTHVFVQAGVGGLAAAVCAQMWQRLGAARPRFVIVEPARAACLMATARAGRPTAVSLQEETVMAGLSCGEISPIAWTILDRGATDYLTIGEDDVAPIMRLLASGAAGGGTITAGESAVSGLIGLLGVAADPDLRRAVGLTTGSRVLVFGSEGATDPQIYASMVGHPPPGEGAPDGA
ncbi:diaminopropionate ammonia-lyase [Marinibaculum pumilum]|uniref:Diaminopropionate ammonia-lyase n=1 Tax=Marinibaculum pumilum TaxID=1766165 RepID=A0ABV7L334_9PROT